jgi:DNA processing protein
MKINCKTIAFNDSDFPFLLKQIQNPPAQLFVHGELPLNYSEPELSAYEQLKIAIVGTRKSTTTGKIIARNLAKGLSTHGIIIVSGLAMGIDTAAHEGCLEASGKTIAVLANGLDKIYPAQNENLAKKIVSMGGALISEYPLGTPSYPNQFLERNRIVSGLCTAVIVIEAPERSGSLATARNALEQGREVFVVPGPADHPNYKGSHQLIRDGARLITSIEDIFEDLNIDVATKYENNTNIQNYKIEDANQLLILKVVQEAGKPISIDKILETSKLDPQTANQSIALLTIAGVIKETAHGYTV